MDSRPRILKISSEDRKQVKNFVDMYLDAILEVLIAGGTIVFPTETLYGLGADIFNESAIDKVINLKGRPKNMPIAVAVANLTQARTVAEISQKAENFIHECIPRPVTLLLPVQDKISDKLTGGSELIGLRFPKEPISQIIIEEFGPITATSANLHDSENLNSIEPIIKQFGIGVDIYIDVGSTKLGEPSTVVDISSNTIKIIRYGACSGAELEKCIRRS
jgi:L-threonylcarbamoyladenylate synthase